MIILAFLCQSSSCVFPVFSKLNNGVKESNILSHHSLLYVLWPGNSGSVQINFQTLNQLWNYLSILGGAIWEDKSGDKTRDEIDGTLLISSFRQIRAKCIGVITMSIDNWFLDIWVMYHSSPSGPVEHQGHRAIWRDLQICGTFKPTIEWHVPQAPLHNNDIRGLRSTSARFPIHKLYPTTMTGAWAQPLHVCEVIDRLPNPFRVGGTWPSAIPHPCAQWQLESQDY